MKENAITNRFISMMQHKDKAGRIKVFLRLFEILGIRQEDLYPPKNDAQSPADLSNEFDLLIRMPDTELRRVPFSQRNLGEPIGIFPINGSPMYLELNEVEGKRHVDKDVDNSRLPETKDCDRIDVSKINPYLQALGKPILKGCYLAENSGYMPQCGWIYNFDNQGSDYYGGSTKDKLRYAGYFYN